ncbi:MAG: HEPN domain-containing protein [Flammeovirgaceae bacterium]
MKTKAEHISHWVTQAEEDWQTTELLFAGKRYLHSLFFAHLSLEKICKAHWLNANESNVPSKTHNPIFLLSQTTVGLTDEQKEFLLEINRFQIEGRYPEQILKLHHAANAIFARTKLDYAKQLQLWLLSKLPST